ncbi:hypothetical protein L195_g015308, partial [Trifolium pratense]
MRHMKTKDDEIAITLITDANYLAGAGELEAENPPETGPNDTDEAENLPKT